MAAIEIRELTKYYGKTRGIDHISFDVDEGAFFGFIGPNGAGKSTTIRTLLGLLKPTSGSAYVLGNDIESDQATLLKEIGYLPSEAVFYTGMRVRELLKLAADVRGLDCTKEAKQLCERLQLDYNQKIEELSFGNRKKVGIIAALQHQPKLLILDEPTSGLDPLMQKEFFDILGERNQNGTTIFLSSHILSEVQRNCTKAAIIRGGRIIVCDSVETLAKTNAKRVQIRGKIELGHLEGMRDRKDSVDGVSFLYSGDMNPLLQCLSQGKIQDLSISDPDLEEIFLHYYEKDGEAG